MLHVCSVSHHGNINSMTAFQRRDPDSPRTSWSHKYSNKGDAGVIKEPWNLSGSGPAL